MRTRAWSLVAALFGLLLAATNAAPARKPKEPKPDHLRFSGSFDTSPKWKFFPKTVFPPFLIEEGTSGEAIISFKITAEGYVEETKVVEATHPAFGSAALGTVGRMVFTPAKKDGKAVPVRATISFAFEYEDAKGEREKR
jgi:TonB family protein